MDSKIMENDVPKSLALDSGERRLNELGYKQELKRELVSAFCNLPADCSRRSQSCQLSLSKVLHGSNYAEYKMAIAFAMFTYLLATRRVTLQLRSAIMPCRMTAAVLLRMVRTQYG